MRPILTIAACGTMALAACNWGTRPHHLETATSPQGALVAVRVIGESQDRIGELYAADSIGLLVRSDQLVRIPWAWLEALDVDRFGAQLDIYKGMRVTSDQRARLAAVSRFPRGLDSALLGQVLQRLEQDSIRVVGPAANGSDTTARPDLDTLARAAATAGQRYVERRVAIADGYRRVGANFPGMGEHWVHAQRIATHDSLDASRPSFLSYVTIAGRPRLVGVGFIVTTEGAESAVGLPGWPDVWHEHSGVLTDESGGRRGAAQPAVSSTRVWVLHVWTALDNPHGRFAADNWALPFARLEVPAPETVDADAGRAVSLLTGGDHFLRGMLADAGLATAANAGAVDRAIERARDAARDATTAARGNSTPSLFVASLRAIWAELADSLHRTVGPDVRPMMAPPHAHRAADMTATRHRHAPSH